MSPRTVPSSTTFGTCTGPSMEPVALTERLDSRASSERTAPAMCPSRCSPPWKSTSPCTRALLPIRVSMRDGLESRVNMGAPTAAGDFRDSSRRRVHRPQEALRNGRHVLLCRAHFDLQLLGLEGRRQVQLLVQGLQVAEVEGQRARAPASERGKIERLGLPFGSAVEAEDER